MRIAAIIVATFLLIGTAGIGVLGANRGMKDAKSIDAIYADSKAEIAAAAKAGDKSAAMIKDLGESTNRMRIGGALMGVTGGLALILIILTFLGKPVVRYVAAATVVAALAATFISPQYDLGPLAPASARSLGYVVLVFALLGAASAFGAYVAKERRGLSPA